MKNYITLAALSTTLTISTLYAQKWTASTQEEDWGETIYTSQTNPSGDTISIFSATDSFEPAMLLSPYKNTYGKSFSVDITIDRGPTSRFQGEAPEQFEEIYVGGVTESFINEMKEGSTLNVKIAGKDTLTFSLSGSSSALDTLRPSNAQKSEDQFPGVYDGSAPADESGSQSLVDRLEITSTGGKYFLEALMNDRNQEEGMDRPSNTRWQWTGTGSVRDGVLLFKYTTPSKETFDGTLKPNSGGLTLNLGAGDYQLTEAQ